MTEDEAKEKWCPFTRPTSYVMPEGEVVLMDNRGEIEGSDQLYSHCIGSKCMAWRWNECMHFWGNAAGGACVTLGDEKPPAGFVTYKGSKESLDGYCGLAGRRP